MDVDKQQLNDAICSIILVQGYEFIKELLRRHKIPIGTKNADFPKNILAAIDDGTFAWRFADRFCAVMIQLAVDEIAARCGERV